MRPLPRASLLHLRLRLRLRPSQPTAAVRQLLGPSARHNTASVRGRLPPLPHPMSSSDLKQGSAEVDGTAPPPPSTSWFKQGYIESFRQWFTVKPIGRAEYEVLSLMPNIEAPPYQEETPVAQCSSSSLFKRKDKNKNKEKNGSDAGSMSAGSTAEPMPKLAEPSPNPAEPAGARRWLTQLVRLDKANMSLNELSITHDGVEPKHTLVMLHGYGAGLGFYFKNYEPLSRDPRWRLFSLDLPGMGRSERVEPPFRARVPSDGHEEHVAKVEAWFVDALEEWREQRQISKFVLLGHSLGGYLSTAYTLKYPGRVERLILASPVGVPDSEQSSVHTHVSGKPRAAVTKEAVGETEHIVNAEFRPPVGPSGLSDDYDSETDEVTKTPPSFQIPKIIAHLWDSNVSPFAIIRGSGPLGPRLVSGWSSRRFAHLSREEEQILHQYSYNIFRQPGSGEYALPHLLAPGAFARYPLIHRIMGLRRSGPNGTAIPTTFLYGDADWMDKGAGLAALSRLSRQQLEGDFEKGRYEAKDGSKWLVVPEATHNLFLDQPDFFNKLIKQELDEVADGPGR